MIDATGAAVNRRNTIGWLWSLSMALALVGACSRAEGDGGDGTPTDPCAGKACGAACALCEPTDSSCSEPVLGYCDASGQCSLPFPVCPPPAECTVDGDCPVIQSCALCPDGSLACPEARCIDGRCIVQYPECPAECRTADDCPQLGMPCEACPDGSVVCPGFDCVGGACVAHFPHCDGYEPCEGKACGARCTACDPRDPDCTETGVLKFCDEVGTCQATYPECPPPPECTTSEDCPGVGACPACPGGLCAELECVSGQCIFVCPPEPPPECTSASDCPAVGMPCVPCPDGFAACPAVECVGGACVIHFPTCDGHDPCAGKACGDTCDLCGGACGSPVAMYCDASGHCGLPFPLCDDICQLPPEVGPCDAAMPRWYFDAAAGRCTPFIYGGCQGNANNFMTATACAAACAPSAQPCEVISCATGTSCVYLGPEASCAAPCAGDGTCPPGFTCECGASCPGCRDCVSVCTPAE